MDQLRRSTCISINNWVSLYKGLIHSFIPRLWRKPRSLRIKPWHMFPRFNNRLKVMCRRSTPAWRVKPKTGFKPLSSKRKQWFQRFPLKLQGN